MVNIAHWRLLNDGRVVVVAFSEKFDDIKPPCEGHVRAEALLGGFIFTPVAEGTKIQYLVEVSNCVQLFASWSRYLISLDCHRLI